MPLEPGEHRDYSSDEENSSPYLSSHNKNLKKIPMPLMHGSPEILEKVLHHPDDKQSSDEDMAHNQIQSFIAPDDEGDSNSSKGDEYNVCDLTPKSGQREKDRADCKTLSKQISNLMKDLQPILERDESSSDCGRSSLQKRISSKMDQNQDTVNNDDNHLLIIDEENEPLDIEKIENLFLDTAQSGSANSSVNSITQTRRDLEQQDPPFDPALSIINQGTTTLVDQESNEETNEPEELKEQNSAKTVKENRDKSIGDKSVDSADRGEEGQIDMVKLKKIPTTEHKPITDSGSRVLTSPKSY